ncbi:glycosylphosphatidylinositol anchor biosynthesis [Dimargaris cristalligena]|nr:glycosylphosphatidylinositol anchor biosynthesis [Dimargaris cristalligena]
MRFSSQLTLGEALIGVTPLNRNETPWRKLLYIKQEYPDNYVDESFLENLQKNVNFQSFDYFALCRESTVITEHISSVLIFVAVFIQLYHDHLDPHLLVSLGSAFASAVPRAPPMHKSFLKTAAVFFLTLLGLSPILRTLTQGISSDSIWAMSVCLFITNILFFDYSSDLTYSIQFPGSVALNAAVFACVLLASRLSTNLHAFGFMSFALEWFALFPIFRRYLKRIMPTGHLIQTLLLVAITFVLFWPISRAIAVLYMIAVFSLTFICPIWLIFIQRYKNEIHGPWDEARPKVHRFRSPQR